MASRRQRQYERKYNTFRKFTATEDVSYSSHTSRSSFRSESVTQKTNHCGRSTSSEIISSSETRSLPVYIAIHDYTPEPNDSDSVALEQGQIVEVLDKKNASSWLIRTKARPPKSGWVPGCFFETPTEYYKQRRRTREISEAEMNMSEEQQAIMKRDQVYHDLLRSEEEFVEGLRHVVDNYIRTFEDEWVPQQIKKIKEDLASNIKELYNFHANVLLKGLQYYSDDPGKVGQTFIRLEKDFDHHVYFHEKMPSLLKCLADATVNEFIQEISNKSEAGSKNYEDYIKDIAERMVQYQNYFKEFVKYSSRAKHNTKIMQKALELTLSIPQRATDLIYINNIEEYPGDVKRLGRLYRHDVFLLWENDEEPIDCYAFLFKNKLLLTKKDTRKDPPIYKYYSTIRLDRYAVGSVKNEEDTIEMKPHEYDLPTYRIRAKDIATMEIVRQAWLKNIQEMKDDLASDRDMETETTTEPDMNLSDIHSEFSEYSTLSRSLFGPEEGPPRKKIKSPPVISPTASSTSLYSGGSSSIDWTTTGTTLDMQGTRVTRTQYGFRSLQESSAKMCLKVTGYPLPEITWYKGDELLKEDERHTFYSDEDGFFALTIDPVKVEDTGRYTCMATNEYGQASTSAFFRVHRVEKETAAPVFITTLKDHEIKEGETVSFECEVEGWPEPELLWLIDDQPLRPSHDFRLEYDGQKAKLEIRDAQPEDTGIYIIRIRNEYGSAESNAKLTVEPDPDKNHVAPDFQATIDDVDCNEGDTVRFKAVITGDPTPDIVWMLNGIALSQSEKIKFISEDGILILTIHDVSRHFDGIVTCQATNRLGMQTCDARIRVRVPPSPPQFIRPLEDRVTQEGGTITLETEISGFPRPKVSFMLQNKTLVSGINGVEIADKSDGIYRIEISHANLVKHDGEIICTAMNEHGQAESRARIIVEPIEEESKSSPTFLKDLEDQTVKIGEVAVFETAVDGTPKPEVIWFIDGEQLTKTTIGAKIEVSENTHKLTLDSMQHAGVVLCKAENSVGRCETRAKLIILDEKRKKPQFLKHLTEMAIVEGSNAIFEIEIEAEPKATLNWTLSEKNLIDMPNVQIREFDSNYKVEISNVSLDLAGTIKCIAENSEGSSQSTGQLIVKKKPHAPKFEKCPENIIIQRGSEAYFDARANATPEPKYQWSVEGRKVTEMTDGVKIMLNQGVSTLIIDTNKFGSSTVSVTAENDLGFDETSALLIIEESSWVNMEKLTERKIRIFEETDSNVAQISQNGAAEDKLKVAEINKMNIKECDENKKPFIIKPLQDQAVKLGENAHFSVEIKLADKVEWFSNERKISAGMPGVTIIANDNYEFRLTVDSAQFAGTIAVKAENSFGIADSSAKLTFIREIMLPEFVTPLVDTNLVEGETLKMVAETSNASQFEWRKGDIILKHGEDGIKIISSLSKTILEIDQVKCDNDGTFIVLASNEAGQVSSIARLTVTKKIEPAKIVEGPKSVSIKEMETAEFVIKVTGTPTPIVQWMLNTQIVKDNENISIKTDGTTHTLIIDKAILRQAGEIVVVAQNPVGTDTKSAILKIEPDITKPVFKIHLIDRTVNEEEPLRWDVSLEHPYKGTRVSWILNGEELVASDKVQIEDHGDGSYHLTIADAKPGMAGTLVCKAENSRGVSESRSTLTVTEIDKPPKFTKSPQDHDTIEETSVKFSATVTGKPKPNVSWLLNNVKIDSSEEIKMKYDESTGKTSIRIMNPKESHSGTVTVQAENRLGKAEASSKLTVTKKNEPPRFINDMNSRQVDEGTTVKFSVTVAGYPKPDVQWFLHGKSIEQNDSMQITVENDIHTLIMKDVVPEQTGEICCEAKNAVGSKKQFASLAVKMIGSAPIFEKNLEDRLVREGEEIIMEAVLSEIKPKPSVVWLRDGKLLADERFLTNIINEKKFQLKVLSATMDDKSRITIRAENQFGIAECSASIGVQKQRPMAKPNFLSDIAPVNISEGETLETKVLITGDPTPFAKWYINDQLVCATEDTQMKAENGIYTLIIHGATKDMTGTIKCTAYNKAGEVSTQGPISVVAPIPVEFETVLCDATCREGDTLKLKAVLMGEPTPDVTWYVNGKQLEESQNIKIHAEKGTYTVTIKDITCDYSGKVVCEAVNEYGRASSEAMLLVLPRGEPPDFIEWLSNIKARPGSRVTHKVVFTGDPKPNLLWYINGEEMKNDEEISIITTDNTSTLIIKSFDAEKHIGEIICKAENDAGEVSCTASMAAYTSDMFSESESDAMADETLEVDDFLGVENDETLIEESERTVTPVMAPKFIKKIKDTRTSRGHQAIFECIVPDTKGVCCKWLKDGKEIELIARIRVQTRIIEGFLASELIIDEVELEDAGKYTVVVENAAGMERCEAMLNVYENIAKPDNSAPDFTIELSDKISMISEKIVFECKVTGEPQPTITWFHEKVPVVEETFRTIIESEGSVQRLTIPSVEFDNKGRYICIAENIVGRAQSEATLTVQAEAPKFIRAVTDKAINLGEKLVIECAVKGLPQPFVQFFSGTTRLTSNSRISIEHDATNVNWRMVINSAEENDFTTYRVLATNTVGTVEGEAVVRQKDRKSGPIIEQGMKNQKVVEGDEIKIFGQPMPETKCFKNGEITSEVEKKIEIKKTRDGQHTLTVKKISAADSGCYSIEVVNSEDKKTSDGNITVVQCVEAPDFIEGLSDLRIVEAENAELNITVLGIPEPEVEWFKNGAPLNIDGSHLIEKRDKNGQYKLIIHNARVEDAGSYSCHAQNKAGKAESAAKIAVEEFQQMPQFDEELKEISVHETESAELLVTVSGYPEPEVLWLKDNLPVNIDNIHLITKKSDDGKHKLIINKALLEDAGTYSCKAVNKAGSIESEAKFVVVSDIISPEFVEKLREIEVSQGDRVEMSCAIIGSPLPEVIWLKDGVEVLFDNNHIFKRADKNGKQTLIITQMTSEDVGAYSCIAINTAGKAVTSGKLNFPQYGSEKMKEEGIPLFIEPSLPYSVAEGETVTLECKVNEESKPEVKWYRENEPTETNEHWIMEEIQGDLLKLTVLNATKEDVGYYRCEPISASGQAKTEAKLDMYYGATAEEVKEDETMTIRFIAALHDEVVQEGEIVKFKCIIDKPDMGIKTEWHKDDKIIDKSIPSEIQITSQIDGTQQLTLEKAKVEDAGIYKCIATQGDVTISTECKLSVSERTVTLEEDSRPPEFIELMRSCTTIEKNEAIFRCKVKGKPRPKITWTKDGQEIIMERRVKTECKDDGTLILRISDVRISDIAEYRCDATNEFGSAWTVAPLTVTAEGAPPDHGKAPDFIEPIRPISVIEGSTAILVGRVTGEPQPIVTWHKGEVLLKSDDRIQIESLQGGIQRLIIQNAILNDTDEYRCSAFNEYGDVWCDVTLTVQVPSTTEMEPKEMAAPTFLKTLEEQSVEEGEHVCLECKIVAEPMPQVKWYKDKQEIMDTDARFIKKTLADGTTRLVIDSAIKADAGEFRCEAQNPYGSARTEAALIVRYAFEEPFETEIAPEFLQEIKAAQVNELQEAIFECRVSGMPLPKIKWYKDGEQMKADDNVKIESFLDGTNRLIIKSVNLNDQGNYRCEAINSIGSMSSKAPLTVNTLETLKLVKGLEDLSITVDMKVELTVEVEGQPKDVKWFKGKDEIISDRRIKMKKISAQQYSLEILNSQPSDSGEYRVVLCTETESVESSSAVTINEISKLVCRKGLNDKTVRKGEKLVLEIEVDGKPKNIKWYKDGSLISAKAENLGNGEYQLSIPEINESHAGQYSAVVSDEFGTITSSAKVTVQPIEEKPEIINGLQPITVKVGDEIVLEVKTKGDIKSVKWYKNGNEMKDVTTNYDGNKHQMVIARASIADDAEYKIVLSNNSGDAESAAKLTVKQASPQLEILNGLVDIAAIEGEKVLFEITASYTPDEVQWFKNGELLSPSEIMPMAVSGTTCSLTIPRVSSNDIADYKVIIYGNGASAFSSCSLMVKLSPLQLKKNLEDQTAVTGKKAAFDIQTNVLPKHIKWYKNGREIEPSDKAKQVKIDDQNYQLEIPEVDIEDIAEYKVVLSNEIGEIESSAKLSVKEFSPSLEILKKLNDISVGEGVPVELQIEASCRPDVVKWYKDRDEITSSDDIKLEAISETIFKLTIPKTTGDYTANYKVVISKQGESAFSQCSLIVKVPAIAITKGLKDQTTAPGEKACLQIELNTIPRQIKWYKNGKEIGLNDKAQPKKISDKIYELQIEDTTKDDTADYKVVVSNERGLADSSCSLIVKLPDLRFTQPLRDQAITEHDTVQLIFEVNTSPESVKWYKNDKEISPNDKAKSKKMEDCKFQLEIPDAKKEDTANYKVIVSNDNSNAVSSCALTVKLPALKIIKGLDNQNIDVGEKALFSVETNGAPQIVKWYKNGKEIGLSDKAKAKKVNDSNYQLEIPDATIDDSADYKVILSDNGNFVDSTCALTVRLPPQKPTFIKGIEDQFIPVDASREIIIKTTGSPKTVKWYKNGQLLINEINKPMKIQMIDDNNYILTFEKVTLNDSGSYTVEIENEAGKAKSSGEITVEPHLAFLHPLKDMEVIEGEKAEFTLEANAHPRVVKWYKNGREIKDAAGVLEIKDNYTKFSLIIAKTNKGDAADYKIVLSNSIGDIESSAKLLVKKSKGQPKILKGLEDQVILKGDDLILEIKIDGEPTEIRWLKNDSPLSKNVAVTIEKLDEQTYRLVIPRANVTDAGSYSVEAVNEIGKARTSANIGVDEKPEIVKGLEDCQIDEGDEQIFRVETNTPIRAVKWYKNDQEINLSHKVTMKKINPKKFEMSIGKASLDDGAIYKVILSNSAGECGSSASLTVVKPNILRILSPLKDTDVNEGEPIKLLVKIEGQPREVKWLKNGKDITSDDRITIEEKNDLGEYWLAVPCSVHSDGAAYRIVLSNDRNEVQSGCIAHVKAKRLEPATSTPTIVSPLIDVELPEGETLTLKCKVAGEPKPEVKWLKDGKELIKNDHTVIRMALDGTAMLRILDTTKINEGRYCVTAYNSVGESSSSCNVHVLSDDELPSAPRFIIPLKDVFTQAGLKVELGVKVKGIPKPNLDWFINDVRIIFDDEIRFDDIGDGNWTLIINSARIDQTGRIRCVATNKNGKAECDSFFTVTEVRPSRIKADEGYPPRFNVPLWDRRIPDGQLMIIECHVDAKPLADIQWNKDGILLQESEKISINNTSDGACRLRIYAFSQSDIGLYTCIATNALGSADTCANLNIQVEEINEVKSKLQFAPRFNPPLVDKYSEPGEKIYLSCRVEAEPKPSVTWFKDGLPLRNDGRTLVEVDEVGNCLLTILSANESDSGAYRCVAANELGSTNTACTVNVKKYKEAIKKEGEKPFFTKGIVDKWVDKGETLKLTCAVVGDPTPDIRWYRNGTLIRTSGRYKLENLYDGTCSLTVVDSKMTDEGIYRCEAENIYGKANTQSTIHVEVPIAKIEPKKIGQGEAPRFVVPLEDLSTLVDSSIELECRVTGDPMPTVKWSKDGAVMLDDPRYVWETDASAGFYKLKIDFAQICDEGTYRCVASNETGSATSKAFVRIDDGKDLSKSPEIYPPFFTISIGDIRVVEGQPLKLECKVEGLPLKSLIWYKDGERILPSDHVHMEMDGEGRARLIIPHCAVEDEGLYRVIATNAIGSAHDKGTAIVKRLPKDHEEYLLNGHQFDLYRAPKVIIPLESCKIPEEGHLALRCKFSGDPRPSIKWFKDGERLYAYGRCQLNESDDGSCELVINNISRFDAGNYRCVAENIYGSARTINEVVVQMKERKPLKDFEEEMREGNAPGFSIPLTVKRVKVGADVVLECLPYGKPFPNITWLKDGIEIDFSDRIKAESTADGIQKLILNDVDFSSEGFYRCVATNEYGTASTKGELNIDGDRSLLMKRVEPVDLEPKENKPRIRPGLYNISAHHGTTIEMQVCVIGWPVPIVKWFKNDEEIKSDGPDGRRLIWEDDRGIHHCIILNCISEDEGDYSVEATNKLGIARSEGGITVIRPREVQLYDEDRSGYPYPPGFIRQLKNKHTFSHMPAIFDCLVVGNPPPQVDWYHNDKKIIPNDKIRIQSCGGGSHALIILDTKPEDVGQYMAVARNAYGTAKSSALLDVTIPHLDEIKFNGTTDVTPYLIEEYGFKKQRYAGIPTPPDRGPFIKEVNGHYLTLSWIPTKRTPPRYPQVTYIVEIRELPFKEWVLLDYNIPEPVCKVRNLELGKSYQFRVRAENIYGISDPSPASPPSRLMAPPQPVLDQYKRVIPLLDPYAEKALGEAYAEQYACAPWFAPGVNARKYCAENELLTINLFVSGYPDPNIMWKFRGIDIDASSISSRSHVVTHGGMETTLTVSGFNKEDVGQYQCIATNQYGEAQQSIFVDIGTRPIFLQPLVNKIVTSGKTLRLDVRVGGNPSPELKWMKDWRPIVESSRISFGEEAPYFRSLIITDLMWRDCGIYSAVAINSAGTATTTCSVTVEADGNFNDIQPTEKKLLETKKIKEIYEIDEDDEKNVLA